MTYPIYYLPMESIFFSYESGALRATDVDARMAEAISRHVGIIGTTGMVDYLAESIGCENCAALTHLGGCHVSVFIRTVSEISENHLSGTHRLEDVSFSCVGMNRGFETPCQNGMDLNTYHVRMAEIMGPDPV